MIRKGGLIFLLGSLLSIYLFSGEYRLQDLLQIAFKNNPDLLVLEKRVAEQQERLGKAQGTLLPLAQVNFSYLRIGVVPEFSFNQMPPMKFATANALNLNLNLSYNLWDWGASRLRLSAERDNLESSRLNLISQKKRLRLQIATLFLNFLQLQRQIELTAENLRSAEQVYQLLDERYKKGYVPEFQALQAKINRENISQQLLELNRQKELLQFSLKEICVLPAEEDLKLLLSAEDSTQFGLVNFDPQEIVQQQPEIKLLTLQKSILGKLEQAVEKSRWPSVSIGLSAELRNGIMPEVEKLRTNWNVSMRIVYQLFDGNFSRQDVLILQKQIEQVELNLERTRKAILFRISSLQAERRALLEQLQVASVRLLDARRSFEQVEQSFKAAYASYLDVLNSQLSLNQAQLASIILQHQLEVNRIQLEDILVNRED